LQLDKNQEYEAYSWELQMPRLGQQKQYPEQQEAHLNAPALCH